MQGINVIISGTAGQGIQTIGYVLAKAALKSGYAAFAWQEYESRIRGGKSSFRVFVTTEIANTPVQAADILLSLDPKTNSKYRPLLTPDGVFIEEGESEGGAFKVPFSTMAKERFGNALFGNTIAAGLLAALIGVKLQALAEALTDEFSRKGQEIVEKNIAAAREGYGLAETLDGHACVPLPEGTGSGYRLLTGNEAVALGAVAADCRFMAAYPMSPSTGVITFLSQHSEELQVLTEQAEDEIAAVNMAIGANFAGVRSMTATSGGGFSLMVEGLSLAGMTETPVVILIAQRPGPATGLPTRTEQGDLLLAIHGGHGDFPRFVVAPSDPMDALRQTARAFNLADKYQVPAIILTDQILAESFYTIADGKLEGVAPEYHLADPEAIQDYKRYRLTDSGVSPRLRPGQSEHLVTADSDEHDEYGHITEDLQMRVAQMDKRQGKLELLRDEVKAPEEYRLADAEVVLVSWGSTRRAVFEAVDSLRQDGTAAGAIHFTEIWPLPHYAFDPSKQFYVVEGNYSGHLQQMLWNQYGLAVQGSVRRYDGLPLGQEWILQQMQREGN